MDMFVSDKILFLHMLVLLKKVLYSLIFGFTYDEFIGQIIKNKAPKIFFGAFVTNLQKILFGKKDFVEECLIVCIQSVEINSIW